MPRSRNAAARQPSHAGSWYEDDGEATTCGRPRPDCASAVDNPCHQGSVLARMGWPYDLHLSAAHTAALQRCTEAEQALVRMPDHSLLHAACRLSSTMHLRVARQRPHSSEITCAELPKCFALPDCSKHPGAADRHLDECSLPCWCVAACNHSAVSTYQLGSEWHTFLTSARAVFAMWCC